MRSVVNFIVQLTLYLQCAINPLSSICMYRNQLHKLMESLYHAESLASSPGHPQILSRSHEESTAARKNQLHKLMESLYHAESLASSPGHPQILSRSHEESTAARKNRGVG